MADFILCMFFVQRGRFLHSADALVGMTYLGVVLFTRTGYIATFPGTARRPFPTVSLVGGFFQPHGLYSLRCLAMNHRRYIAWFRSSTRVLFAMFPTVSLARPFLQPQSSFDKKGMAPVDYGPCLAVFTCNLPKCVLFCPWCYQYPGRRFPRIFSGVMLLCPQLKERGCEYGYMAGSHCLLYPDRRDYLPGSPGCR